LANIVESQSYLLSEFEQKADEMASKGYRVLGYAIKEIDALPEPLDIEMLESSLLFIGFRNDRSSKEEAKQLPNVKKQV
jgi:Ca2+-transporting ATPase